MLYKSLHYICFEKIQRHADIDFSYLDWLLMLIFFFVTSPNSSTIFFFCFFLFVHHHPVLRMYIQIANSILLTTGGLRQVCDNNLFKRKKEKNHHVRPNQIIHLFREIKFIIFLGNSSINSWYDIRHFHCLFNNPYTGHCRY